MEHRTTNIRGKHQPAARRPQRAPVWRMLGAGLGLAMAAVLLFSWPWLRSQSRVAAAYGAKVGCSCHYIGGRPLADCTKDFEPGMGLVWLRDNAATHTITARYAILASQQASWRPGPGCVLEPWKD